MGLEGKKGNWGLKAKSGLVALAWVYFTGLVLVLALRFILGDFSWWSFALNSMLLYVFALAPIALILGVVWQRRELVVLSLASLVVWVWLWGGLFLPRAMQTDAVGRQLTVMAYNLLGFNFDAEAVVRVVRDSNADVIGFQELNPQIATVLEQEFIAEYPYQLWKPQDGVTGAGLISRYPFQPTGEVIADEAWVSEPDILSVSIQNNNVTLMRFHAVAQPPSWAERERQAQKLADYAQNHIGPLVVFGDLNATDQNDAYRSLVVVLKDAWREAGTGFGHTFPGASTQTTPGSSRPQVWGWPVPQWLVRIDFVFYSNELEAVSARLGEFDGASDHRPVIATLRLK
jgi:endonuclease/exonuclease/phosphatase (EEP) superfamily protein YafD